MQSKLIIKAEDNHQFDAYVAKPEGEARAAIIVMHEIFGVTDFIKEMCELWAGEGYLAIAPSLYDRLQRDIVFAYDKKSFDAALATKAELMATKNISGITSWELQLIDIDATIAYLQQQHPQLAIGMTGFCWGGTMCWLSSCRLQGLRCVCSYYGTNTYDFKDETPKTPFMLHAADFDEYLSKAQVDELEDLHTAIEIYRYPAMHAFRCSHLSSSYAPKASAEADDRSKAFFAKHLLQ